MLSESTLNQAAAVWSDFKVVAKQATTSAAVALDTLRDKGNSGLRFEVEDLVQFPQAAQAYYKAFGKGGQNAICLPCLVLRADGTVKAADFPLSMAFRAPYEGEDGFWRSRKDALSALARTGETVLTRPENFADFVAAVSGKVLRVALKDSQKLPTFKEEGGKWVVSGTKPRTCYGFCVADTSVHGLQPLTL